jgi:hypothetical protein
MDPDMRSYLGKPGRPMTGFTPVDNVSTALPGKPTQAAHPGPGQPTTRPPRPDPRAAPRCASPGPAPARDIIPHKQPLTPCLRVQATKGLLHSISRYAGVALQNATFIKVRRALPCRPTPPIPRRRFQLPWGPAH